MVSNAVLMDVEAAAVGAAARAFAATTNASVSRIAAVSSAEVTVAAEVAVDAANTRNAKTTNASVLGRTMAGQGDIAVLHVVDCWACTVSLIMAGAVAVAAAVRGPVGRRDPTDPTTAIGAARDHPDATKVS